MPEDVRVVDLRIAYRSHDQIEADNSDPSPFPPTATMAPVFPGLPWIPAQETS